MVLCWCAWEKCCCRCCGGGGGIAAGTKGEELLGSCGGGGWRGGGEAVTRDMSGATARKGTTTYGQEEGRSHRFYWQQEAVAKEKV
jgi:hypothetical protein